MTGRERAVDSATLLARWALGAYFIWMGWHKAVDPVGFLKLVRAYDLVETPVLLNLIAAGLPWFEIFCGLLLLVGVFPRGAALLIFAMLVPFTLAILRRALRLHETGSLPFCLIKFDCGCGSGEVFVCRKLGENTAWIALSAWLAFHTRHWLTCWPRKAAADAQRTRHTSAPPA
jgi:uncharacterized membrane protein YphA (DoxX/SURF4 family)